MKKIIKFKDKMEKNELIYYLFDDNTYGLNFRNNSIILKGKSEFSFKPLYTKNNYLFRLKFFINYDDGIFQIPTILKKDKIEVKLYPLINDSNEESFQNFNDSIKYSFNDFFLVIYFNNEPKYIIDSIEIKNRNWFFMDFYFENNKFKIFFDKIEIKKILDISNNEIVRYMNLSYELNNESKYYFLTNLFGMFSMVDCYSYEEDLTIITEEDFIDFKYTDFYSLRECSSTCPSACLVEHPEKDYNLIYKPRIFSNKSEDHICTFKEGNKDPFTFELNQKYCSGTSLIKINENYPSEKDFGEDLIQSTHYKIEMSLNEHPLSEKCVIDEPVTSLIYTTFETTKPVTRVARYVEYLRLKTDFTGKPIALYEDSINLNWSTRNVAKKNIIESGYIDSVGDSGFSKSESIWEIEHNLKTYNIICQCFNNFGEMRYPAKQWAKNENVYVVDWGNEEVSGYALLSVASSTTVWEEFLDNPFRIVHNLNTESEPDIFQMQNIDESHQREEPINFQVDKNAAYLTLLEKYKSYTNIMINKTDKMFYFSEESKVWNIQHDLKYLGVQVQIYDMEFNAIQAKEIILIDKNNAKILFDKPFKGYAGFKFIGNPYWKNEIIENIIEKDENGLYLGYFKLGDLSDRQVINKNYGEGFTRFDFVEDEVNKRDLQSSNVTRKIKISDFYETKDEYIFEFVINNYDFLNLNINEIGLFDKYNKLCFYSVGDLIYYPQEYNFRCIFRIFKEEIV